MTPFFYASDMHYLYFTMKLSELLIIGGHFGKALGYGGFYAIFLIYQNI